MSHGEGVKPSVVVALIGLTTAIVGLASSPFWAPAICSGVGVCKASQETSDTDKSLTGATQAASPSQLPVEKTSPPPRTKSPQPLVRPPSPAKNDDYQGWGCPDSEICAWDQRNGQGERLFQKDGTCDEYDIASVRDRLSSFENRTRFPVVLYDWNDTVHQWDLLTTIAAGSKGNLGQSVDNRADMIKICG